MSFLAFIASINPEEEGQTFGKVIAAIEDELKLMPKNSKIVRSLHSQLLYNKIIHCLQNENYTEARKILRTDLRFTEKEIDYDMIPIEANLIIKTKNYHDYEHKVAVLKKASELGNSRLQCVFYLFQLSVFYNLNNQKKYTEVFYEFINEFFLRELNAPTENRFLSPTVFT